MKALWKVLALLATLGLSMVLFAGPAIAPVTAAPVIQTSDPSFQVYFPLLFQHQGLNEPNDSRETAGGPLICGQTYTFDLHSENDHDWYYFDTGTLGKINILMSDYGSPNPNMTVELYDGSGRPAARSWTINYFEPEKIDFLPISKGRYYIHVYHRAETIITPGIAYNLRLTCNQPVDGSGEITGLFKTKGLPAAHVPATLKFWDPEENTVQIVDTMTDAQGRYHFWGMPGLRNGQQYEIQFHNWSEPFGRSYVGLAYKRAFDRYSAGSVHDVADLDISPIVLQSPNALISQKLPITFSWVPRPTRPLETYRLYFVSASGVITYWYSPDLGHTGSYVLEEQAIRDSLNPGETYKWMVLGGYDGDYFQSQPNEVNFLGDWD